MMKAVFRSICVFLLVLCVSPLCAETITHVFNTDVASYGKVNNVSNKQATMNDGFVYTCGTTGDGKFWLDEFYKTTIALNLTNSGEVITSPVLEGLIEVTINCLVTYRYNSSKFEIYISTDGTSWTLLSGREGSRFNDGSLSPTNEGIQYIYDNIPKGDYFLKMKNNSSAKFSIFQIEYKTDPSSCACLQVVSQ